MAFVKDHTIAMPYDFIKLIDLNAVINQYNSLLIFLCFDYHQAVFGDLFFLHNFNSYKRKVIEIFYGSWAIMDSDCLRKKFILN